MKKKNLKNGFTLVELLVVIALMSLLTTLVVPNVITNLNKANQKLFEVQEQEVEDAAKIYMEDYCRNPIDELAVCPLTKTDVDTFNGQIDIETLITLNYLDEVSINNLECTGYVSVTDSKVHAYLNCGNKYISE